MLTRIPSHRRFAPPLGVDEPCPLMWVKEVPIGLREVILANDGILVAENWLCAVPDINVEGAHCCSAGAVVTLYALEVKSVVEFAPLLVFLNFYIRYCNSVHISYTRANITKANMKVAIRL